tara:strand:- start:461 stop:775 length:315 start_codon:yes stop_codon:yes gene_type:complete
MSIQVYPHNTNDTILTFDTRHKHFVLYLDNYSCFKDNPKDIRRAFGKARNVPSVKAMEAWAEEMCAAYVKQTPSFDKDRILNEGFGPEAHGDEEEPNDNTMMIT